MSAPHAQNRPDSRPSCPICAAPRAGNFCIASDRLFGIAPGTFPLFRCVSCGCVFQYPMPPGDALACYYPEEYWWSEGRRSGCSRVLSRMERAYREFVALDHVRFLERCAAGGANGRALLDIGCGSGTFLHLAQKRGFQAHGMDVSARAVAAALDQYHLRVRQGNIGSNVWDGLAFDFITMFHVLEHLPDPSAALCHAGRLLRPGGSLLLQVPNISSLQARLFGARWYGLDVPRHLINFTPGALQHLLRHCGFSSRVVRRFSLRDDPASLASSIAPALDPIGRRGRGRPAHAIAEIAREGVYFGVVLLAVLPALAESLCGYGGTIWIQAHPAAAPTIQST